MKPGLALVVTVALACTVGCAPDVSEGQALADHAAVLYDEGDFLGSAESYAKAADVARRAGRDDLRIGWQAQAAVGLKMGGKPGEARPLFEEALAWARANDDAYTLGLSLGNMARVESMAGRIDAAIGHMDELADLARAEGNTILEIKTLDRAASAAADIGDLDGALARYQRAVEHDAELPVADQRRDELLRGLAWVRVLMRDDEGAAALWRQTEGSPASQANQARHIDQLGLHAQAAELAREASLGLEAEGDPRLDERDRALRLVVSALLAARELDAADQLLDTLMQGDDELALAPFRALRGRVAMARGAWASALEELSAVRAVTADDKDAQIAAWLEVVALIQDGQFGSAHVLLDNLTDSPAARYLRALALVREQPEPGVEADRRLGEAIEGVVPDVAAGLDRSLRELREHCPLTLPSSAHVVLELNLAASHGLRASEHADEAAALVKQGARSALLWQALERIDRVEPGRAPDATAIRRVDAWVAGQLTPEQAIIDVIAGEAQSYLLICTKELGATSLGLPPRFALTRGLESVVAALRTNDMTALYDASRKYHDLLFTDLAREDLDGKTRWTLILPDELTAIPPAMYLADDRLPGEPVPWLVRTHVVGLLPHALAGRDGPPEAGSDESGGWVRLTGAEIAPENLPLSGTAAVSRFGPSVLQSAIHSTVPAQTTLEGPAATAAGLRKHVAGAAGLELAVPATGGGRLGGVFLSPQAGDVALATWGDEALGFVPWHRLADIELPPLVVLDHSRFDPVDAFGATYAATALMTSADAALMTRWPMAPDPLDVVLDRVVASVRSGVPLAAALTAAQRLYLEQAEALGSPAAAHPRNWGGWLGFSSR